MKTTLPSLTERKCNADWLKTPYPNPIRYKPTGTYSGRVRVNRKSIRRSLETGISRLDGLEQILLRRRLGFLAKAMPNSWGGFGRTKSGIVSDSVKEGKFYIGFASICERARNKQFMR